MPEVRGARDNEHLVKISEVVFLASGISAASTLPSMSLDQRNPTRRPRKAIR